MMGGITAMAVVLTEYRGLDTPKRASTSIESDECRTWVQDGTSLFGILTMAATDLRKRNPFKHTKLSIDDEADDHVLDEQGVLIFPSLVARLRIQCFGNRTGAGYTST